MKPYFYFYLNANLKNMLQSIFLLKSFKLIFLRNRVLCVYVSFFIILNYRLTIEKVLLDRKFSKKFFEILNFYLFNWNL